MNIDAVDLVVSAAVATSAVQVMPKAAVEYADRLGELILGRPYSWTPLLEMSGRRPDPEWLIQAERCRRELQTPELSPDAIDELEKVGERIANLLEAAGWRPVDGSDFVGIRSAHPHWRRALGGVSQLP
ncbi:MAG: hypothetical protein QM598_07130 [Protaetiibacter sp.]